MTFHFEVSDRSSLMEAIQIVLLIFESIIRLPFLMTIVSFAESLSIKLEYVVFHETYTIHETFFQSGVLHETALITLFFIAVLWLEVDRSEKLLPRFEAVRFHAP